MVLTEGADPEALGRAVTPSLGGRLHFVYRHALRGFAATLSAPAVEALRGNANVTRVDATASISGTSMASPHTAGVAALYLESEPSASPTRVSTALYEATTKNIVTDALSENAHLLYNLFDGSATSSARRRVMTSGARTSWR